MLSFSPSCRILTVASTLERAVDLVEQIKALSPSQPVTEPEGGSDGTSIPWTISNKYYSADVHFLARSIKGLAPYQLQGVPAVIFVWGKGDAYKHHISRLAQDLKDLEPEVSLAVRLPTSSFPPGSRPKAEVEDEEEKSEDENDTDEFLSSHGFEFVDVTQIQIGDTDAKHDGIPSLPRVLDALSTIMWPSMHASTKSKSSSKANDRTAALLNWAQSSIDDSSVDFPSDDDLVVAQRGQGNLAPQARAQREMAELARWLEEDSESKDDPWKTAPQIVHSPTEESHDLASAWTTSHSGDGESTPRVSDGFDDDFTVFVSAPAASTTSAASDDLSQGDSSSVSFGRSSPSIADSSVDADRLIPSYSGVMYHSLGSHSDLGESHEDRLDDSDDNDSDDGLPTNEEIQQSAQRIFGTSSNQGMTSSRLPADQRTHDVEGLQDPDDDDNYNMAAFDLSHVLGALQGMKTEIAGIEDEQERRKAAARVALGLVYGLEREAQ
ncbi:hypothetical protein VNI00_002604 [Paramarasmius palmivorus]|uniref:Uncharacterized protein n=1 Tax=Paramarasmius palmivorus TaxID=297713 RepID=A0AAW0DZ01_9AGAR